MKNWSSNEVCNWLRSLGMEEYQQNFHDNRIDGSVLCIADHQMLKELNVESTDRIKILKAIQGINDGSLGQDVDSLVQIVSRNDRIIDDLQHQIESVKKDLAVYRMAMQPKLAVKTGEDRKIPQRTLSSPENADKAIKIIPLGQEEIRAQITEKDLCKAVIADTLAKLKITCDWKDYVMLLHISKKSIFN
jgi:hypothetical protein